MSSSQSKYSDLRVEPKLMVVVSIIVLDLRAEGPAETTCLLLVQLGHVAVKSMSPDRVSWRTVTTVLLCINNRIGVETSGSFSWIFSSFFTRFTPTTICLGRWVVKIRSWTITPLRSPLFTVASSETRLVTADTRLMGRPES